MRIAAINSVNYGSTGKIMLGIAECARNNGIEYYTFSSAGLHERKKITGNELFGSIPEEIVSDRLNIYKGTTGRFNYFGTRQLIDRLNTIDPDIIHLHNLHSNDLNLKMLFNYIRQKRKRVVWTLHDCWAFTGKCPYAVLADCDRWKTGCFCCPQLHEYPVFRKDNTDRVWELKKELFSGIENMTIVTPSEWLADLVKQSFLKDYPVRVINNGIDLDIFKPTESDFRETHEIRPDQTILLGVANVWDRRKGLEYFMELDRSLDDSFQIVLVGTDDKIDRLLPPRIISLHHTKSRHELAEIYSAADIFINPTLEDTYPTVNLEALACGTPVITFDSGGSLETIKADSCGVIIGSKDTTGLLAAINKLKKRKIKQGEFENWKALLNEKDRYLEYIKVYENSACGAKCSV